jgi:hypothetical protein
MGKRVIAGLVGLVLLICSSATPVRAEEKANPQIVKFPELAKIVVQHRGTVVVVDLWAEW